MNKDISFKSVNLKPLIANLSKKYGRHAMFAAIIFVLLIYVLVAFKINRFAQASPDPGQESDVSASIPKIDKTAINQIQSLEQSNVNIKAFFENARNNPFQE